MKCLLACLAAVVAGFMLIPSPLVGEPLLSPSPLVGEGRGEGDKPTTKLLIAFTSYRDRPKHPNILFYEHDGVAGGKVVGAVGTPRQAASADSRPSLSHDGRYCAFTFEL